LYDRSGSLGRVAAKGSKGGNGGWIAGSDGLLYTSVIGQGVRLVINETIAV